MEGNAESSQQGEREDAASEKPVAGWLGTGEKMVQRLPDVAILIDWENLKISLTNAYGVGPNISSLLEAAREEGRVVAARAYGDWTRSTLAVDASNLYRQGIDPVFTPSRTSSGVMIKNSADVRLAVDAVDLCRQLPHVATYIVVTGDGDLVHATNYLRLNGRRVVVLGVRGSTSVALSASADETLEYERDLEPTLVARTSQPSSNLGSRPGPSAIADAPHVTTISAARLNDIRRQVMGVLQRHVGSTALTTLGNELRRDYGFDSRRQFGVGLKEIVRQLAQRGDLLLRTEGSVDIVSLRVQADVSPELPPEDVPDGGEGRAHPSNDDAPVGLENLTPDERRALTTYILDRGQRFSYFTYNRLRELLLEDSVLPRLDRTQLLSIIGGLETRGAFETTEISKWSAVAGRTITYKELRINVASDFWNVDAGTERVIDDASAGDRDVNGDSSLGMPPAAMPSIGTIEVLFADAGYGFIRDESSPDVRRLFTVPSPASMHEPIRAGDRVTFIPAETSDGRASAEDVVKLGPAVAAD